MNTPRMISTVESHTAGEPTRIIIGGIPKISGKTMNDKKEYFNNNYDYIRKTLMFEPRGSRAMFGVLLTEPVNKESDFGAIFMDSSKVVDMCGHASIGLATTALECGWVELKEPHTIIKFDIPNNTITTKATIKDGKIKGITLEGAPSFFYKDVTIDIPKIGKINAEISFGGNFFALVDINQVGIDRIKAENVYELISIGKSILDQANEQIEVKHPTIETINSIFSMQLITNLTGSSADSKNITIGLHSQVDRSPCGSGTCARLAALHAKGQLDINEEFIYESVIGTRFSARIKSTKTIGRYQGIIPEVFGSAYLTSMSNMIINKDDPLQEGFLLT